MGNGQTNHLQACRHRHHHPTRRIRDAQIPIDVGRIGGFGDLLGGVAKVKVSKQILDWYR